MRIRCKLGHTLNAVGGTEYEFKWDGNGNYVAEVADIRHQQMFLSVEHFEQIPDTGAVDEKKPAPKRSRKKAAPKPKPASTAKGPAETKDDADAGSKAAASAPTDDPASPPKAGDPNGDDTTGAVGEEQRQQPKQTGDGATMPPSLEEMDYAELVAEAETLGVSAEGLKKAELIDAILEAEDED